MVETYFLESKLKKTASFLIWASDTLHLSESNTRKNIFMILMTFLSLCLSNQLESNILDFGIY